MPALATYIVKFPFVNLINSRIIYQFHGLAFLEWLSQYSSDEIRKPNYYRFKLWWKKSLELWVLNNFPDEILAFSKYSLELLRQAGVKTTSRLALPGLPIFNSQDCMKLNRTDARNRLGIQEASKVIVIASRLEPRKGVFDFLRILEKDKILENATLLIASDFEGGWANYFFSILSQIELKHKAYCFHNPTKENLHCLFKAADVVAVPSTNYETYGFTSVEALECGAAVVAYDIGANKEVIPSKWLANVHKPESILHLINSMLSSSSPIINRPKMIHSTSWQEYINTLIKEIK
jgi:glycosyltransferase involved in cell wall biosynthesis